MRKIKKIALVFVCLVLMTAAICPTVFAAENSTQASLYLSNYGAVLYTGARGTGTLDIDFNVTATRRSDYVGISKVEFYTSDGTLEATITGTVDNGLLRENATIIAGNYYYTGTIGTSYYAVLTMYAERDGGSDSKLYTTNTVTAR